MKGRRKAIVINEHDNVATALEPLAKGSRILVEAGPRLLEITLVSDVPMAHKFALTDLGTGQRVVKYGQPIGRTVAAVARGGHVHAHNLEGPQGKAAL